MHDFRLLDIAISLTANEDATMVQVVLECEDAMESDDIYLALKNYVKTYEDETGKGHVIQ